ncbi:uncharacterized protein LOC132262938 [Phlebotomus argentipes]|uniref:uncharacterized protein LOC132262938 n=1 Tax=Phlebotomus argentipes TaxID=94469 RepID=UPI00289307F0|nr:uncharacterized protein LOC132262938 [Phlebotomus argentipes]
MEMLQEDLVGSDRVDRDFLYTGIPEEMIRKFLENHKRSGATEELKEFEKILQDSPENLIEALSNFNPTTFNGYLNLLQASVVVFLTQNPSVFCSMKIAQLRCHLCRIMVSDWVDNPVQVHLAVEKILEGLRSVHNTDLLNVAHICWQLCGINDFLFIVALSLAWEAFEQFLDKDRMPAEEIYRPQHLSVLIERLQGINMVDYQTDLLKFFVLLKIVSLILRLMLPRVPPRKFSILYAKEMKVVSMEKLRELNDWCHKAQKILRIPGSPTIEKIKIREVMEFEIFTALDQQLEQQSPLL